MSCLFCAKDACLVTRVPYQGSKLSAWRWRWLCAGQVLARPPPAAQAPAAGAGRKYHIHTFGCQMNLADSERMAGTLEGAGYSCAEDISDADVVVYNTCSIRDKAEQKVYSALGKQVHAHSTWQQPLCLLGAAAGRPNLGTGPKLNYVIAAARPGHWQPLTPLLLAAGDLRDERVLAS